MPCRCGFHVLVEIDAKKKLLNENTLPSISPTWWSITVLWTDKNPRLKHWSFFYFMSSTNTYRMCTRKTVTHIQQQCWAAEFWHRRSLRKQPLFWTGCGSGFQRKCLLWSKLHRKIDKEAEVTMLKLANALSVGLTMVDQIITEHLHMSNLYAHLVLRILIVEIKRKPSLR